MPESTLYHATEARFDHIDCAVNICIDGIKPVLIIFSAPGSLLSGLIQTDRLFIMYLLGFINQVQFPVVAEFDRDLAIALFDRKAVGHVIHLVYL